MKDNMAVMQRALNYAAMGANSTPNRSKSAANSSAPKLGSANPAAAVTGNRTQRQDCINFLIDNNQANKVKNLD